MGTAKSGYIQRRIIKINEDIQTQYDNTVRDITGEIYQLSYGNDGMDPSQTVKVSGEQQPYDISRIISRLNLQHEMTKENEKNTYISRLKQLTGKTIYNNWSIDELKQRIDSIEEYNI